MSIGSADDLLYGQAERFDEIEAEWFDEFGEYHKRILDGFTIDQMVENMEKILQEVAIQHNTDKVACGNMLQKMQYFFLYFHKIP